MKYPIGIQSFEKMRKDSCVYVDKTRFVHQLAHEGCYYFLSRPRRFGKSLLLSTMAAYFRGQRELFSGLAIEKLETEWTEYPVLHLDLNGENYIAADVLREHISEQLHKWEEIYGCEQCENSLASRFARIIERAAAQAGRGVVILIDEYDKPIIDNMGKPELQEEYRNMLRGFYSVMKSQDQYIHFAFLTGITKISHMNIFSGLNNIKDISMAAKYADICGVTEDEMHLYFDEGIEQMAKAMKLTHKEMCSKLRWRYDGYHFHPQGSALYNPYSLINALDSQELTSCWFESATPKMLLEVMKRSYRDLSKIEQEWVKPSQLATLDPELSDPIPLMYQSGYLTIKGYDRETGKYMLSFPNGEVREGITDMVIPHYVKPPRQDTNLNVDDFVRDVNNGDAEGFMMRLKVFLAGMDYQIAGDKELYFHNVVYAILMMMGIYVEVEKHTSSGRIDAVIKTHNYIYVIEFKLDGTAAKALEQIERNEYALPYALDGRKVYKIGCGFSSKTRTIRGWRIAEVER